MTHTGSPDTLVHTTGRAFENRLESIRCTVSHDGTVRVWDSIAGHYTLCHSLSQSARRRIRKLASEALASGKSCRGHGSLRVEALYWRAICTNGMIRESAVRKAHLGRSNGSLDAIEDAREFFRDETRQADDRAFFLKVGDAVSAMFDPARFDLRLNQYREASTKVIAADPVAVVERTAKRLNLSDTERSSVLQHLVRGNDLSAWGLANAITRTAEDAEQYDRASELEGIGGRVVELKANDWAALSA
jgi:hypothetical protein